MKNTDLKMEEVLAEVYKWEISTIYF